MVMKTVTQKELQAIPGNTQYPGVRKGEKGYEFTAEVPLKEEASLLLYLEKGEEREVTEIPFPEESRRGNLLSVGIKGLGNREILYNYRIGGETVQDPYAQYLCHVPQFGKRKTDEEPVCSGYQEKSFKWTDKKFQAKKLSDMILYKLQVRSFTMHKNSGVRKKGTFQGLEQKIPYLQELGITSVLLMPAYEYREILRMKRRGQRPGYQTKGVPEENPRVNCWGYTGDACYFAPKRAFCASGNPVQEFRHMVNALHEAGLECLMEFYFDGTTAPSRMLDILRYWKTEYHIDGFHLMGQGICQEVFTKDPMLADSKLLFHDVNGWCPLDEKQAFFKNAAEYNQGFLYCMRHILKGDENMMDEFMFRTRNNPPYHGIINYLADQDGFTMMDMVSYEERHNEANGEDNQDGMEYNCSWNCGTEGATRKKEIRALRLKQLKNAFSILLCSQGTPLIFQGDEWGNTQKGNNNAWCQDNETAWIDWRGIKNNKNLFEFVKQAIAFRKANPMLHMEQELKGADYKALGYPDISCHGSQAWYVPKESTLRFLGTMLCGGYGNQEGEFLYIACNFHWISHETALPGGTEDIVWNVVMRTDEEENSGFCQEKIPVKGKTIEVPPRTIIILMGKQDEKTCRSGSILKRSQSTSF